MSNRLRLSPRLLQLQMRLAERRIVKINAILESGVQVPTDNTIDTETAEVISRLQDQSLSEADTSSCVSILEMLLEVEIQRRQVQDLEANVVAGLLRLCCIFVAA